MSKVLVVDDELHIVELLRFNLELSGFEVIDTQDGREAFDMITEEKPDLVLLDWMLPGVSGIDILTKIRSSEETKNLAVIMLTAKNVETDMIEGLDKGADDYITKPFSIQELMARVKTVLRRLKISESKGDSSKEMSLDGLIINLEKHEVSLNGEEIDLSKKEFELLRLLFENRGKVLTRNYLLDQVWGYEYHGETRTVDVHIRYLRKKLESVSEEWKYIETIRGVGYKLK